MHGASEIRVLVTRGRMVSLLLVWEISIRLIFHKDFRDGAATIRAKAIPGLLAIKTDDMLLLPSALTYDVGLPSKARILGFWDGIVPIISGTCMDTICSFLP